MIFDGNNRLGKLKINLSNKNSKFINKNYLPTHKPTQSALKVNSQFGKENIF